MRGALQDVELPAAELVHASYSLPFLPPADFGPVWQRVRGSLAPGGLLAVTLFGAGDTRHDRTDLTLLGRRQARELFLGLEVLAFDDRAAEGTRAGGGSEGPGRVFEVIARRMR
ncbi:hypothetical protein ACFQZC_04350 [Streptacidiphilus monticola]